MMRTLLALFLLTTGLAFGQTPSRVELPPPEAFVSEDSISIAVIHARPEDAGFRALLSTAWQSLSQRRPDDVNPLFSLVLGFFNNQPQGQGLASFLPLQAVRVDSLGADGQPHPTIAVTVSGWAGLQNLFYGGLLSGGEGAFPTRDYRSETLVLREGWEDPTQAKILSRVRGTFINTPSLEKSHAVIDRLQAGTTSLPDNRLTELFSSLDRGRDTYGAILNREGSLLTFLYWLNQGDVGRVHQTVGKERLEQVLKGVRSMAWEGDLVSDNQIDFLVRFDTESVEARKQVAEVLKQARDVLAERGRAGDLQISSLHNQVIVNFSMVGYRGALQAYINRSVR